MPDPDPNPPSRRQHMQALLLAALCSVLFLRGALLSGMALVPFPPQLLDVQQAEAAATGSSDAALVFRGNVGMGDKYFQSLCWDRVLRDRLSNGELPRWTRDIGGGAPFVPQMAQPYHPSNALLLLLPSEQWYGWNFLLHQVLFGWFAYVFFRHIGCGHAAGLFGVVVAALGCWVQSKVHHNVVVSAALPVWPMLLATHRLTSAPVPGASRLLPAGVLALASGMSWLSGFAPVSLQASWLCTALAVLGTVRLPAGERARAVVAFGGAMLLGAGVSFANTAPILMAWADSARRVAFDEALFAQLGMESAHLLTLGWPDLLAHAADRVYAGTAASSETFTRQPWSQLILLEQPISPHDGSAFHGWVETAFSIGACGSAVCVMAWARPRHRVLATFFAAAALIAFGVATASEPWRTAASIVPGMQAGDYRRCTFVMSVALVALAVFGVDGLAAGRRRWPLFTVAGAVTAVSLFALWWLARHAASDEFIGAMAAVFAGDPDHPLVRAVGGSAAEIAAAVRATAAPGEAEHNHAALLTTTTRGLLVGAFVIAVGLLRPARCCAALLVIAIAELVHVGIGPVQAVPAADVRRMPAVLQPVLDATPAKGVRPRLARLMPPSSRLDQGLPGNFLGWLGIEDASFYSALAPQRAVEFFTAIEPDRADKDDVAYRAAGVGAFHDPASLQHALCDLLGIRFVLGRVAVPESSVLVDRTPRGAGDYRLYERTTWLPRATFVTEVDVLTDANARLLALSQPDRDVRTRVVLEDPSVRRPAVVRSTVVRPETTVTMVEHRDELVCLRVDGAVDGYLRLADPYDAGWCATVDGVPTPVRIADHYLRAVYVPSGRHEVVFSYDGARVLWPPRVSAASLLAVLTLLLWGRSRSRRSR